MNMQNLAGMPQPPQAMPNPDLQQMWFNAPPMAGPGPMPYGAPFGAPAPGWGPFADAWAPNPWLMSSVPPNQDMYMAPVNDITATYETDVKQMAA